MSEHTNKAIIIGVAGLALIVALIAFNNFPAGTEAVPEESVEIPIIIDEPAQTKNAPPGVHNKEADKSVTGLQLTEMEPSPVVGSDKPQRIVLKGSGFPEGSRVALSRNGKITVIPATEVEYLSDRKLAFTIATGTATAEGAVMIGTPDKRSTKMLRFEIVSPKSGMEESPTTPAQMEKGELLASDSGFDRKARENAGPAENSQQWLGSEWLAKQPETNYTLQLLASSSQVNLEMFLREHPGLAPLGKFAMENSDGRYYVLTMGSYRSNKTAQAVAAKLPDDIKPWSRSILSVKEAMIAEPPATGAMASADLPYKDTAWLWSQDPNRYTVQLLGAGSDKMIEQSMQSKELDEEVVILPILRNGKPWYVLIYGNFDDRAAATQAIERLPSRFRQNDPWARKFADLQGELSRGLP